MSLNNKKMIKNINKELSNDKIKKKLIIFGKKHIVYMFQVFL